MYPQDALKKWHSGQGLWKTVPKESWNKWSWQVNNSIKTLDELKTLINLTKEEEDGCKFSEEKLLMSITPYFFNLIDRDDPNCPIRKQVIPRSSERIIMPEEMLDPVGEEPHMPVQGLVHKYPDRVLFLVTSFCGSYCRYCTRSRLVSNAQNYDFHPAYEKAIAYIEKTPSIRDVLISGGDPLLLPDKKIGMLLKRLRSIPHVEFIRIGTRIPVFMPQRITPLLCQYFEENGPIWMSIHVNHPKECTLELKEACKKLLMASVVLGNQSVLLKEINDSVNTMRSLCHRLLQMGVKPYYIYQCDLITGSSHFRTDVQKGIDIISQLRGHTTGYAVPQLVIDAPGGGGKIPLNPETIHKITEKSIFLKNYQKEIYEYPLFAPQSPLKMVEPTCMKK
ncbi:MAG: L-lysine 2,3-aminomutase [Chlamydiae bacterium]|nr:L-lysine 2,3-aminomutase [Chlamydiota bacterium]